MMKLMIGAAALSMVVLGSGAFAASGSSGLDASSSTANNSVGSSVAGGGSMRNPGGVETPKNADVFRKPGIPGASQEMRSDAGRDAMQNSTLGSSATTPRGDSR